MPPDASKKTRGLPTRGSLLVFFAALAAVIAVGHGSVVNNALLNDDASLLLSDPPLASADFWQEIPFRDYCLELFDGRPCGYYRPVFVYMAWLEHQLFGDAALGYRIVSLITLFVGCSALAALVWRFSKSRALASMSALFLACAPLKTEAVGFVTAWPDLVMSFAPAGLLWAMFASRRKNSNLPLLAGVAFGLTLLLSLTKELGLCASAAIAPCAFAIAKRRRMPALLISGAIMLALLCTLIARSALPVGGTRGSLLLPALFSPFLPKNAPAALWSAGEAVRLLVIPEPAQYLHYNPYNAAEATAQPAWASWAAAGMAAFVLAACLAILCLIMRRRPFLAGVSAWLFGGSYLLFVAIASGFHFWERYICVGPACILFALGARWLGQKLPILRANAKLRMGLVVLWISVGAAMCFVGTAKGETRRSFWTSAYATNPEHNLSLTGLASVLFEEGNTNEAAIYAQKAVDRYPNLDATRLLGAELGYKAMSEGDPKRALHWYQWTLDGMPQQDAALKGKAVALAQLHDYPAARSAALAAQRVLGADTGLAQIMARIWLESPDIPVAEAAARAREAKALGAAIPDILLTPQGVSAARQDAERAAQSGNP